MWRAILRRQARRLGVSGAARALGVSPAAVSLLVRDRYPGGTDRMAARVLAAWGRCPHTGEPMDPDACRRHALGGPPTASPGALRWWRACQDCPHRPDLEDL